MTVRRYRNDTGYPLEVPGLTEAVPPGGDVDEDDIALQHDPELGGSIPGLTLLDPPVPPTSPPPEPAAKPVRKTTTDDTGKEVAAK